MNKELKELVTTVLYALIEDGKRGISNAVQDKDLDWLDFETSKIDYAVREIINLQEDDEGFKFFILGRMLRRSNPSAKSMESNIKEMISFYEDCLNDGWVDGEEKTTLNFNDDEIKELVNLIEQ